jgi:hypothetical protein
MIDGKINELRQLRRESYKGVFDALLKHKEILENLYEPLMKSLQGEKGTLGKLRFGVQRVIDLNLWSENGEKLLDLRKGKAFRGKGELLKITQEKLAPSWKSGTSEEITGAMAEFWKDYRKSFEEHCPVKKSDKEDYKEWLNSVDEWLYSTAHISIEYGVQYDEIDIQQLSPGTRGIVLLLLYLAIDKEDYRPLIIDQPEENLDPKSIFDELVERFRTAKLRRQIIIVTHNANLVVNTDADQVIVASCGSHRADQLPEIEYVSGGLENAQIRKKVCEILEGGEDAFKERAKRLRVHL